MLFDLLEDVFMGFLNFVLGIDKKWFISDSVLGCFVCLVDFWGEILWWSFVGGCFIEMEVLWYLVLKFC